MSSSDRLPNMNCYTVNRNIYSKNSKKFQENFDVIDWGKDDKKGEKKIDDSENENK